MIDHERLHRDGYVLLRQAVPADGLDAEGQLKMMSDKDLNGKVVDLKKTLAILDRGNVGESSTCRQRRRDSQRARFPIHSPDL